MLMCTYTSSRVKRKGFYRKSELHMFLLLAATILVHQNGTPIWRLRTKLYKGAWNVSANNSETVGHKDLRLGKIVYILVFYNISFSWILLEDGSQYTFLLRNSENDQYDTALGWQTPASKNADRWRSQNPRAWIYPRFQIFMRSSV